MTDSVRFLLRRTTGDQSIASEQVLRDLLQRGQARPSDFLYDFTSKVWCRLGDHPTQAQLMGVKPTQNPERKLIYFLPPGTTPIPQGPFSTKDIQAKILARELCESTWVFVDGDKEWRQIKGVKVLFEMLPALPVEAPAAVQDVPSSEPAIDVAEGTGEFALEQEEPTMAFSPLGLALKEEHSKKPPVAAAKPLPSIPSLPPAPAVISSTPLQPSPQPASAVGGKDVAAGGPKDLDQGSFDGITAEIPSDPVWMIKQGNSDVVSGPFRFLEVIKYLEEGKLNKNDKISKASTNRFVKIQQQYEFNVKFSVESVIEKGVEVQKILIRRRHPRVPYITGVQVLSKLGLLAGNCVNISAGGILMEIAKAEFNLGEILEIKILPGLIARSISCKALVIGKIPKAPPGYALKFEDLKNEDKEAIEFFVQEAMKREMSKNG